MEHFLRETAHFLIQNWAMLFIILIPHFRAFLKSLKEFVVEMKKLSKETHIILKKCDERLTALEQKS